MDVKLCVLLSLVLALTSVVMAQPTLTCTKSGNDVVLNWSGGTSPFDAIKDTVPYFSGNPDMLLTGSSNTTFTDSGALTNGITVEFYTVADATKPTINITGTTPSSPTSARTVQVNGTYTNATYVSVNTLPATFAAGSFSASPVVLFIGGNTITASAMDTSGNVAFAQTSVSRLQGNTPPEITFTPADGDTIYDDTPDLKVLFCDADGFVDLVNASVVIQLDGTVTTFSSSTVSECPGGAQGWAYTYTSPALSNGYHSVAAAIRDTKIYYINGSARFLLSNPVIDSLNPTSGISVVSVTITGKGYDSTPANNTVKFGAVDATVSTASATQLVVTVPATAISGPVTVTVNSRTSNPAAFNVLVDNVLLDASSISYEDANGSLWVADRDYPSTADNIWEYIPPGGSWQKLDRPQYNLPYISKDFDSAQQPYYCNGQNVSTNQGSISYINAANSNVFYRAAGATSTDPVYCRGLAVPSNATEPVFFLDGRLGNVRKVPLTATIDKNYGGTTFSFNDPAGAILMNNTDLVISATTAIYKIAPDETVTTLDTGYSGAAGIDWNGTHLLVADKSANKVILVDPADAGNQKWTLSTTLNSPRAVAFGSGDDIWVLEQTRFFKLPRPVLTLQANNGTSGYPIPTKVYADYDPLTASDASNVQYLLLEVSLNPLTLIKNSCPDPYPAKITWTVEDPDDPSDDTQIDENGSAGGDNTLTLGNYPFSYQWDDWDVYTMDEGANSNNATVHTAIVDGVSRVMLNFSPYPGDNFKVTAQVSIPVYGTLEAVSPTITIWKKLYIELDSMGQCDGPMDADDDDAVCSDIPEPLMDLFSAAFRPAYIDVLPANQTDSSMIFRYHLNAAADYLHQDYLGNKDAPNSSSGHWEAYLYGAYEPALGIDNDPDSEDSQGGSTRCSYSPISYLVDDGLIVAATHTEVIRDYSNEVSIDDLWRAAYAALHEGGHWFRLGDNSGGLMNYAVAVPPYFTNCQIKWLRKCNEFPGKWWIRIDPPVDPCTEMCPNP